MTAFTVVETIWISDSRIGERLAGIFQPLDHRVSDDMVAFARHAMGWIQVDTVRGYVHVRLDARAVAPQALDNLARFLDRPGSASRVYRCAIYTGATWFEDTAVAADRLLRLIRRLAKSRQPPAPPATIYSEELPLERLPLVGDAALGGIVELWRQGDLDGSALLDRIEAARPGCGAKLVVARNGQFFFERYSCASVGPWDRGTWQDFSHHRVDEAVPDSDLARSVCTAAEKAITTGRPRLERCAGPIRSSGGQVRLYDWFRLSLPLLYPKESGSDAVLMTVWEHQPYVVAWSA